MAHNLNYNEQTGKYSFYSLRQKPWHSFGQISDKELNSREVLIQSQLAYPVKSAPHIYRFPSGKEMIADNDFFTYREDTEEVLGTHLTADYHIVQNVDAFTFFDSITKGEGIIYETAGAIGKGYG